MFLSRATTEDRAIKTFGAFEAKNRLSELLELVEHGEQVVITKHGRPVAKLVGIPAPPRPERVLEAIEGLKKLREQLQGSGLSWKELRDAGRKY